MSNQNKNLWKSFGGKGFSAEHAEYAERAACDENGNSLKLTILNNERVTQIGGLTVGSDAPDLTNYYYKPANAPELAVYQNNNNVGSLVGSVGNINDNNINAEFYLQWGSAKRHICTVYTNAPYGSFLAFGINSNQAEKRYLLPPPTKAVKYAQTNASGQIIWGDAPLNYSSVDDGSPTPSVNGMFNMEVRKGDSSTAAVRVMTQTGRNGYLGHLLDEPTEGVIPVGKVNAGGSKGYLLRTPEQLGILNKIESISVNGSAVQPDANKNVDITVPAIPSSTVLDAGKLLAVDSTGNPAWKSLLKMTVVTDENGDSITDETGDPISDEREIDLWGTFDGIGFSALADKNGDDITETYATKHELAGYQTKLSYRISQGENRNEQLPGIAEPAKVYIFDNNKVTAFAWNLGGTIRLMCDIEEPYTANFAVEFNVTGSDATVEVYLKQKNLNGTYTTIKAKPSISAGSAVSSGKFYQLTCVGNCWTMAEFDES